jgi:nucleotide-binding universal stress UspA family protein
MMTYTDVTLADIVVGIDGSEDSTKALRWAAAEARRRGGRLKILTAYTLTWPPEAFGYPGPLPDNTREPFEEIVAEAVAQARAFAPSLDVTGAAVLGEPASELVEASSGAAMVVVGNRGRGGFASLLLGSVSQQVATHATVPVVVVRGRAGAAGGPIVVGVDASASAPHIIELAFEQAQQHGSELTAVGTYTLPIPPRGADTPPLLYDQDADREAAAGELHAALEPWREKYPTVAVQALIGLGSPAKYLVERSRGAALLLVGSRGRGALVGTFLGSVGQQLLHHADCPVMIVRSPAGARA